MDQGTADRVKSRLGVAKSKRAEVQEKLDDCYRYAMPGRKGFTDTTAGGSPEEIYDETAVVALEDFASVIHSRLTPDHMQWVTLEADSSVADKDRDKINRDLEEVCKFMFERINASNYTQEAQESFLDMGCSTGAMIVEDHGGLIHSAVPLTQAYFEAGADDTIGGMFRERREVRAELIPPMYPGAAFSKDAEKQIAKEPDRLVTVIDALWRGYQPAPHSRRAVVIEGLTNNPEVIVDDRENGIGSLPFNAFRFSKAAGEIWGRGPIMKVMAGIKTTNLVIELMLQNAAMSMVGMYHFEDDGQINASTIQIEPGALIPRAPGSRGIERIDTRGSEFNVAGLVLDQQRQNIKKGTFSDALADPNRTPASAHEVMYRTQDLAGRISANVGRLTSEFLRPYIQRVLYILKKRRDIELLIPLDRILVTPQGPLARASRQQALNALMQMHEVTSMLYGPQIAAALYDQEEVVKFLRGQLGVPHKVMATPEDARANIQAAMQAMAGQAPAA